MFIESVRIASLANTSYVVGSEQSGQCVVIDPVRDVDQYTSIASAHGVRITHALETHLHNDFVSGARELAAQTGCKIAASASGGTLFPVTRLQDGDEIDLEEFHIRVMHTPGHTPEHISFLVEEQGEPTAIFTGGALLIGGTARVDLLGSRVAPFLARWLHQTIHGKLLKLPDSVKVYPTHSGGSFCSAAPSGNDEASTTIGEEREHNPFAAEVEEDSFVKLALTGLGSYPSYYKYMAEINRRGPDVLGGVPQPASLNPLSVRSHLSENALLVDARPEGAFNERHVPGSFAVPFGDDFATWLGWLLPLGRPLVLLPPAPEDQDAMVRQLIRIGYDRIDGFLAGGFAAWESAGLPVESARTIDLASLRNMSAHESAPMILDVRQRDEYHGGHIKGALNIELGELQEHLDGLPRNLPMVTVCAGGTRASMAASILQRDGRDNVQVLAGSGTGAWIDHGYPSATGED